MNHFRTICLVLTAVFVLFFSIGCEKEAPALQVSDVISDPGAFSGSISVVGITYGYSQTDPTVVGIMDVKELQCTTPNCNKVLLPVKTRGARPAIGEEVRISGAFTRQAGGYLFQAETVEVLARHNLGGRG